MTDFLLELRSEEIPARMQDRARDDLARLFVEAIAKAGLAAAAIETFATPRRLALIARGLPLATEPVREETKGPRVSAPPQALEGFLRKTGLARAALIERDGVLFALVERPGRATADVLAEAIPAIVRGFPWPKAMRWGAASSETTSLRWVRPLQGIVALLGEAVVPCAIDGIESGAATLGHRFHHPGPITIGSAEDYTDKLRLCHVVVDQAERRAIIAEGAAHAAAAEGLSVVADEELVAENAGLTEWPVPLLGRFDPAFLDVPREVIQLTMRTNQKYFACVDAGGALAPAFVCTANIAASDGGGAIVDGNRKVLAARLSDARFFWEQDLKVPLAEQAKKLDRIVFHEKLGTVADKVERVAKLARWLVEEGIMTDKPSPRRGEGWVRGNEGEAERPTSTADTLAQPSPSRERALLADLAEQAALLCKADLVTGMVGEFPELQGTMGGYYARAEGLPDEVADAIRNHYKPVGQGDDVPTAPVTVAVSLADKLDTLISFFAFREMPSGSKDPFALRRAALSALATIERNNLRLGLKDVFASHASLLQDIAKLHKYHSDTTLSIGLRHAAEFWNISPDSVSIRASIVGEPAAFVSVDGRQTLIAQAYQVFMFWAPTYLQDFIERRGGPLVDFLVGRLDVQQREAGVRHDLIDAVFALGNEDDLVRLLARVKALQAFVGTEDGINLLAGYKRAANILKREGYEADPSDRHPGLDPGSSLSDQSQARSGMPDQIRHDNDVEPAEAALVATLDAAEPLAERAIAIEDFAGAMAALASLRAPIDAFFEQVIVNDPDPATRLARLALLARVRDAVHRVADFSKIEG